MVPLPVSSRIRSKSTAESEVAAVDFALLAACVSDDKKLSYPLKFENMRYFIRIYQKKKA